MREPSRLSTTKSDGLLKSRSQQVLRAPSLSPNKSSVMQQQRGVLRKPSNQQASNHLEDRNNKERSRSVLRKPSMKKETSAARRSRRTKPTTEVEDTSESDSDSDTATVIQFDPLQQNSVIHVEQKGSTELQVENGGLVQIAGFFDPIGDAHRLMQHDKPLPQAPIFSFLDSDEDDFAEPYMTGCNRTKDEQLSRDDERKGKASLRCPSGGEEDVQPRNHCMVSSVSFGQLACPSGGDDDDEEPYPPTSGSKKQSKRVKQKSIKKKTKDDSSMSMPDKLDNGNETDASRRRGGRRIKRATSAKPVQFEASAIAMNVGNGLLLAGPDSEDEFEKTPDHKLLGVAVANNVTAYESEVEQSPRQTSLKKRLGF